MTIICYRSGILASDSGTFSGKTYSGSVKKIHRLRNGRLVGLAGVSTHDENILNWLDGRCGPPSNVKDVDGIVIEKDGSVKYLDASDGKIGLHEAFGEYFAVGSGEPCALTAMQMGASALEACKIAAKHHVLIRGPFKSLRLNKKKQCRKKSK